MAKGLEARIAKLEQSRPETFVGVLVFDDEGEEVAIERYCREQNMKRETFDAATHKQFMHISFVAPKSH